MILVGVSLEGNLIRCSLPTITLGRLMFAEPGVAFAKVSMESIFRGTSPQEVVNNPKIMIVDDEPINIKVARKYLSTEGYQDFISTTQSTEALEIIKDQMPDLILLDIMMPEVDGLQVLDQIRHDEAIPAIPIIILTANNDRETKFKALNLGATEFLGKPVDPAELAARVHNCLVMKSQRDHLNHYAWELELEVSARTQALVEAQKDLIHCLAQAAEYRDDATGRHVIRVGQYAGIIAQAMNLDNETVELIRCAAPLHDIGKLGVPDAILLKPDKLDAEEFEIMQRHCGFGKRIVEKMPDDDSKMLRTHTDVGARIMRSSSCLVLKFAARIALTHHEKFDGSGYPIGLAGTDIPIEGRITAVADVFDALSSKRPYKPAFPIDKCLGILEEGRGTHFDPDVLDAFFARKKQIVNTQIQHADVD